MKDTVLYQAMLAEVEQTCQSYNIELTEDQKDEAVMKIISDDYLWQPFLEGVLEIIQSVK